MSIEEQVQLQSQARDSIDSSPIDLYPMGLSRFDIQEIKRDKTDWREISLTDFSPIALSCAAFVISAIIAIAIAMVL